MPIPTDVGRAIALQVVSGAFLLTAIGARMRLEARRDATPEEWAAVITAESTAQDAYRAALEYV